MPVQIPMSMFDSLSLNSYMPHGVCVRWNWGLLDTQIAGDGLVALAYLAIPLMLLGAMRKGKLVLEKESYDFLGLFGLFILFCGGGGHVLDILLIWKPWYWMRALWSLMGTGISSWLCIWYIGPKMLRFAQLAQGSVKLAILQGKIAGMEHRLAALSALDFHDPLSDSTDPVL